MATSTASRRTGSAATHASRSSTAAGDVRRAATRTAATASPPARTRRFTSVMGSSAE
ncbi:hypothetical protein ACFQRB_15750 [Halobaculum litoreum]|uniref:Uncharacterized protein n=1 Tax=Halobaculum litoreum TaxID=3031998 RepID=A0ABD5XV03_9EURY